MDSRIALGVALAATLLGGCSEGQTVTSTRERTPALSLERSGARTIDLVVAGPYALRGLQARLTYDTAAMRLTKVEPGKDAGRLDRVFSSAVAKADGSLVVGLTDTRRVLLPARGALLRVSFEALAIGGTTLAIADALGARDGGERAAVTASSLEVSLP